MSTTMDIVICFDCSLSISFYSRQIRRIVLSILRNALLYSESVVRMALIEFQSHTDDWVTKVHSFTSSMATFQEWINAVQTKGNNLHECKAIVDALDVSLTLDWRPNDQIDRYHEKLVILITDGPPCNLLSDECPRNRNDLWRLSDEFQKQNINLVVVGIEPSVVVCDDFYCALANKTGGEYLPLINAYRVLSFVVQKALLEEDTISQVFRHLNIHNDIELNALYRYSYVEKRARFMNKYCRTMADIRKWLYSYRRQLTEVYIDIISDDEEEDPFEPSSPVMDEFNSGHLYSNTPFIISTPINDDEGYRTRLPTTASPDSSFICISGGSPVLSRAMNLDWNSEIDDNSI